MKVKLKATLVNGKDTHAFGTVVDLKKDEAQRLVERDLAEEYTGDAPAVVSVVQGADAAKAKADAEARAKTELEARAKEEADAKAKAEADERARQQPGGQQPLG
jgi:membrane protein involved in colicin uptake